MAKETTTTRALTGPRELKGMISEYSGTYQPGIGFPNYKSWLAFAFPGSAETLAVYAEWRSDINLSLDRLTFFPESIFLQDPGIYYRTPAFEVDIANDLLVLDIVSVKQLDIPTVALNITPNNIAPGMLGSVDDFNQIIMGQFRLMGKNQNFTAASAIQSTMHRNDFSSASPFAQDSLWHYRILIPRASNFGGTYLGCPASRFIVQGVVAQEDDLPYMMRLKNSYELQEQA